MNDSPAVLRIIGIDPGPIPGMTMLTFYEGMHWPDVTADVIQCSASVSTRILDRLLRDESYVRTIIGCETFVNQQRASKLKHAGGAAATRRNIEQLRQTWEDFVESHEHARTAWFQHPAHMVKQWANDARLACVPKPESPDLYDLTVGMKHARDAARHALFTAVNKGGASDPLRERYAS